jgi:hypothetical protein
MERDCDAAFLEGKPRKSVGAGVAVEVLSPSVVETGCIGIGS